MRFRPVFQPAFEVDATPKTRLPPKQRKNTLISIAKRHYFMLQSKTYPQPKGVCDETMNHVPASGSGNPSKTYPQPKGVCDPMGNMYEVIASYSRLKRTHSRKAFVPMAIGSRGMRILNTGKPHTWQQRKRMRQRMKGTASRSRQPPQPHLFKWVRQ